MCEESGCSRCEPPAGSCFREFFQYVCSHLQLERENYNFFPLNRALSLQHEEDDNELRLETLMTQVSYLVNKMKEEVRPVCVCVCVRTSKVGVEVCQYSHGCLRIFLNSESVQSNLFVVIFVSLFVSLKLQRSVVSVVQFACVLVLIALLLENI